MVHGWLLPFLLPTPSPVATSGSFRPGIGGRVEGVWCRTCLTLLVLLWPGDTMEGCLCLLGGIGRYSKMNLALPDQISLPSDWPFPSRYSWEKFKVAAVRHPSRAAWNFFLSTFGSSQRGLVLQSHTVLVAHMVSYSFCCRVNCDKHPRAAPTQHWTWFHKDHPRNVSPSSWIGAMVDTKLVSSTVRVESMSWGLPFGVFL